MPVPEWARKEKLYTITELCGPKTPLPIRMHRRTLQEYIVRGQKNPNSRERVVLNAIRIGKVYYPSAERFWQFVDESNL